jgi:hypothetical protein
LSELKLLEPAWSSPVVRRECSILLQMRPDGPVTARLAFPASEILEVSTADGGHRFDPGSDLKLSGDGRVMTFV